MLAVSFRNPFLRCSRFSHSHFFNTEPLRKR